MRLSTVSEESIRHLTTIYPDKFIQGFILELMEVFTQFPATTSYEKTLLAMLKKIETANALLWEFIPEQNEEGEAKPDQPPLHLITQTILQQEHSTLSSNQQKREQTIYAMAIEYKYLDKAAYAIEQDCGFFSSELTKKIKNIMEAYTREALVQHISGLNNTATGLHASMLNAQKLLEGIAQENDKLNEENDQLNQTIHNLTIANTTIVEGPDAGTSAEPGLFSQNKYLVRVQQKMDATRWNCILQVTEALKADTDGLKLLLTSLLEALLTPSTEEKTEDTFVGEWLEANKNKCPALEKNLESYKKLPCFTLKEEKEQETYYQCVAYCFSTATFFPKLEATKDKFNNLRPSKQKSASTNGKEKETKQPSRTLKTATTIRK